jgi:hypothetical protein
MPDEGTQASTSGKEGDDAKSDQTVDPIRTEWQKTVASILDNFCEQIKKETTDSTEQEARFTSSCGGLTKDLETAIAAVSDWLIEAILTLSAYCRRVEPQ